MPMSASRKSDHVSLWRMWITRLLEVKKETAALRAEWDSVGLLNELTDEDFEAFGVGITKAEFVSAITSVEAVMGVISGGHATNLYKARE